MQFWHRQNEIVMNYITQIEQAANYIKSKISFTPQLGLILGTGLGELSEQIQNPVELDYQNIPCFPTSTVKFHAGKLVCGPFAGKNVVAMNGRFHFYEGYSMRAITLPVRVMFELGIKTLIVTNAVGGINSKATPGSIGLLTDHINLMGDNPLVGEYEKRLGTRFPDMSEPYSRKLRDLAYTVAKENNINLLETVYAAISGPSFETAAELLMLQKFGVDTVGMSVVPEVLVASQLGMDVLGLSIITDQSLPENMVQITHEKVKQVASETTPKVVKLITGIVKELAKS